MRHKFNKAELELIQKIEEAQSYCKGELELDHFSEQGGWIAMDYRPECEAAFYLERYREPLISDDDVKKNNVNVVRCCDYCGVWHVG